MVQNGLIMAETANFFKAITPSDTAVFDRCDAIYVGVAGTVVCTNTNGADVTFTAVAGGVIPVKATNVKAASTATGIIALYG
jgi:hypothetical protein